MQDSSITIKKHAFPSSYRTGWLPDPGSSSWKKFHEHVTEAVMAFDGELDPTVQDLLDFLASNPVVSYLMANACRQNETMRNTQDIDTDGVPIPPIPNAEFFASVCNFLLTWWPRYIDDDLVGLPFSGFTVGIDPTLSGSQLLGLPQFNEKMARVLNQWHQFLGSLASAEGFAVEGQQWLSAKAKASYQFDLWEKDNQTLPYWNSWNSFFTRNFKNPHEARPIADPQSNQTVICPNDGSLFRWDWNVAADNTFWFKDMNYSLRDILSSPIAEQQAVIDKFDLVDMFTGGYIFQTYLNPYNFHRWWVPVNGKVLFDPICIPGAYFNKLVLPDFGGATTASLPYLTEVNARGLIVFETEDYGRVCCIPLGMSEVSTISFSEQMKAGAKVHKGEEMGMFNYGGSSFVVIYESLPNKQLVFMDANGNHYPQRPQTATSSAGAGGNVTNIGAQIGVWYSR
ncbi:phophatidylserine decarboxylase associated domain-containing protein [Agrobacterium vitis]